MFILGDTGVHVLRVTAVGEHIGRKYADAENQPQKSKYQHYVPGPPRRPFFAERVDDEREQKRDHDGAEHRHQRHAERRCHPDGVKHSSTSAQTGTKSRTKEQEEEKAESSHHREGIIAAKRPVGSRNTSRIKHRTAVIGEQILSRDDLGGCHRRADD